jgi:hypothetical protein
MSAATNMHSVSLAAGSAAVVVPGSHYRKMGQDQYEEYLVSHTNWLKKVSEIQSQEHDKALKRRALEKYREVASVVESSQDPGKILPLAGYKYVTGVQAGVSVVLERKTEHAPTLSTQPNQVEKRNNKKLLRDARVKVQANAAQAKAEILATETPDAIKQRLAAVKTITDKAPLHKAETVAAKSAATRAKAITFGSTDFVTNVDPVNWTVVTRKKGDPHAIAVSSQTTETGHDGIQGHPTSFTSWQTSQDPAFPNFRKQFSVNPRPRNTSTK